MTPPDWFLQNMAETPIRQHIEVEGCAIETLAWGKIGARGLVFLHGNAATAEWWAPIAPFFSPDWRVSALTFSGSGRSGWRDSYTTDQFGREVLAVAEATGVFEGAEKPWIVAHSLGGLIGLNAIATEAGSRFAGLILVDTGAQVPGRTMPGYAAKVRPGVATLEEGMARVRLVQGPAGIPDWMMDHVARTSLQQREDGLWYRCFDERVGDCIGTSRGSVFGFEEYTANARCRIDFLWGEHSPIMDAPNVAYNRTLIPNGRFVELRGGAHNLMLELPLDFVATVRELLD